MSALTNFLAPIKARVKAIQTVHGILDADVPALIALCEAQGAVIETMRPHLVLPYADVQQKEAAFATMPAELQSQYEARIALKDAADRVGSVEFERIADQIAECTSGPANKRGHDVGVVLRALGPLRAERAAYKARIMELAHEVSFQKVLVAGGRKKFQRYEAQVSRLREALEFILEHCSLYGAADRAREKARAALSSEKKEEG